MPEVGLEPPSKCKNFEADTLTITLWLLDNLMNQSCLSRYIFKIILLKYLARLIKRMIEHEQKQVSVFYKFVYFSKLTETISLKNLGQRFQKKQNKRLGKMVNSTVISEFFWPQLPWYHTLAKGSILVKLIETISNFIWESGDTCIDRVRLNHQT